MLLNLKNFIQFNERNTEDGIKQIFGPTIPNNNNILKQININIKTTNFYDYLKEVEVYGIVDENLNYNQYELIGYIERNIDDYIRTLAKRENSYLRIKSSDKNEEYIVNKVLNDNEEVKETV